MHNLRSITSRSPVLQFSLSPFSSRFWQQTPSWTPQTHDQNHQSLAQSGMGNTCKQYRTDPITKATPPCHTVLVLPVTASEGFRRLPARRTPISIPQPSPVLKTRVSCMERDNSNMFFTRLRETTRMFKFQSGLCVGWWMTITSIVIRGVDLSHQ